MSEQNGQYTPFFCPRCRADISDHIRVVMMRFPVLTRVGQVQWIEQDMWDVPFLCPACKQPTRVPPSPIQVVRGAG